VPNTPHGKRIDLQEVRTRNRIAREIVAGLSDRMPLLARAWLHLNVAIDDTPALADEVMILDAQLVKARRDWANLVAAARATLNAHRDAEPDHLWYLRDELSAQGHLPPDSWGRA
jgi:hypothetical protein